MTIVANKKKVSVTIDEDLIEYLEASDENLSAQINDAIREVIEAKRRNEALKAWLDEMDETDGPVDEELVQYYMDLLS